MCAGFRGCAGCAPSATGFGRLVTRAANRTIPVPLTPLVVLTCAAPCAAATVCYAAAVAFVAMIATCDRTMGFSAVRLTAPNGRDPRCPAHFARFGLTERFTQLAASETCHARVAASPAAGTTLHSLCYRSCAALQTLLTSPNPPLPPSAQLPVAPPATC